jgi:succinate dehydrogenase flavin-adding protein (antitoxin of CptAB toxin-antitoxin module)
MLKRFGVAPFALLTLQRVGRREITDSSSDSGKKNGFAGLGRSKDTNPTMVASATIDQVKSYQPLKEDRLKDNRPDPVTMTEEQLRKKLMYQSRYRGMLEMDVILGDFAALHLAKYDLAHLKQYDSIVREYDDKLHEWLIEGLAAPVEVSELNVWKDLVAFVGHRRFESPSH